MSEEKKIFKIGDIVYVFEHWTEGIYKAKITGSKISKMDHVIYGVHLLCRVERNGKSSYTAVGDSERPDTEVWTTVDEAYNVIEARREANVNRYLDEIKTVDDLVRFPLDHCLDGEEYTDYEAVRAYKIKVKELLNIEIPK